MNPKRSNHANWNDLHYDILVKIFMTLSISDLTFGVSRVCHTWRFAACNPLLWQTLDLSALFNSFNIPAEPYAWSDEESSARFMGILKCALRLSCGNVTKLIFPFYICIKNEHLIYAAERCPRLKRLLLPGWTRITVPEFRLVIEKLKGLESLAAPFLKSPQILKLIGENCNNLSELKIMCPFDFEFANSLSTYIPNLKVLSLRCSKVYKEALELILIHLNDLEVLNMSHCIIIEHLQLPGYFWAYQKPDLSIMARTTRLKKLLACEEMSCAMCEPKFNEDGILNWFEYEEDLCRDDEVSSLAH